MEQPRRNVELKARDAAPAQTLAAAVAHGADDQGVLRQRDTYFGTRAGRLKLREQDGAPPVLIPYARADEARARTSIYRVIEVADADATIAGLADTLGVSVVGDKRRRLLLWQGVRIHLDDVVGLGHFVELEAVAPPDSDLEQEHAKVAELRTVLGIEDSHIESVGYAALLLDAGAATERLGALAAEARATAYAPYSQFAVGCALRDETGALHVGVNVENASYPVGTCAEAGALAAMALAGGRKALEIAVSADVPMITPCGGCRQRLAELADPAANVHLCHADGTIVHTTTVKELLPLSFEMPV